MQQLQLFLPYHQDLLTCCRSCRSTCLPFSRLWQLWLWPASSLWPDIQTRGDSEVTWYRQLHILCVRCLFTAYLCVVDSFDLFCCFFHSTMKRRNVPKKSPVAICSSSPKYSKRAVYFAFTFVMDSVACSQATFEFRVKRSIDVRPVLCYTLLNCGTNPTCVTAVFCSARSARVIVVSIHQLVQAAPPQLLPLHAHTQDPHRLPSLHCSNRLEVHFQLE
jgi:hypothetical protein